MFMYSVLSCSEVRSKGRDRILCLGFLLGFGSSFLLFFLFSHLVEHNL
jgi:hypothetical protein